MTDPRRAEHHEAPRLIVVGVDVLGAEVARLVLGHGDDPTRSLAAHGWEVRRARDVMSHSAGKHELTMSFVVEPTHVVGLHAVGAPLDVGAPAGALRPPPARDDDLAMSDGEVAEPYQRVAAYALVTSSRGVLMTQFSERTNAQGQWGLPGGGIDPGEAPDRAAVREAWEESGQVIEVGELALVHTSHWIGRAPTGRLEDFHAVRIVYRASCPEPTDPMVPDVGGTTAAAAWVSPSDLDRLDVASSWRSLMLGVAVLAPDEADATEHDEQDPNADDRARPHR